MKTSKITNEQKVVTRQVNHVTTLPSTTKNNVLEINQAIDTKHFINCDCLELTVKGNIQYLGDDYIKLSDDVKIKVMPYGSRYYNHVGKLLYQDKPFLTIQFGQRNHKIYQFQTIALKVENHVLYESGWTKRLKKLLNLLRWKVVSQKLIDVFIDNVPNIQELMTGVRNGIYDLAGRCKNICTNWKTGRTNTNDSYLIGDRTSPRIVRIYNKTSELKKSKKDYILRAWGRNGIKNENVWRVEASLKSKYITKYKIDWKELENVEYLKKIFMTAINNYIEFIPVTNDSNKSRVKRKFGCISWHNITAELLEKSELPQKQNELIIKRLVKKLTEHRHINPFLYNSNDVTIEQYLKTYNLESWYWRKREYWVKDWEKKLHFEQIEQKPKLLVA